MKKLYNKALMYQSFYNGKWPLLAGGLFIAFMTYSLRIESVSMLNNTISSLQDDTAFGIDPFLIIIICLALFIVYVTITGFNKRNTIMFLNSGPFTKEEIKKNELVFLIGSVLLFSSIYLYISLCIIFRERELMNITAYVYPTLFLDVIKVITVGIAFVCYIEFWDMLFSNTFVTIISMGAAPIALIFILSMIRVISWNLPWKFYVPNLDSVQYFFESIGMYIFEYKPLLISNLGYYLWPIIAFISGIIITLFIIKYLNNKSSIEKMNKVFVFPMVEKISYWTVSFCISIGIVALISDFYYYKVLVTTDVNYNNYITYDNVKALFYLGIYLVIAVLLSLIIERFIKKIVKIFI